MLASRWRCRCMSHWSQEKAVIRSICGEAIVAHPAIDSDVHLLAARDGACRMGNISIILFASVSTKKASTCQQVQLTRADCPVEALFCAPQEESRGSEIG
ncbi:hypothetical protein AVEN_181602-1 [Araneus ventricosus]|uniref:Uncharacterized protein n=1 Tax=Araneus ventricosus TaxID=182803 RepID=A0A4Y2CN98_ARAVE|nr:hypothetical protein AVEN_181602-1 [Araneus ventricosus]